MVLTSIIARFLALADATGAYFVDVGLDPVASQNICGTYWAVYNTNLTSCGRAHLLTELMWDLFELHMLVEILPALFTT